MHVLIVTFLNDWRLLHFPILMVSHRVSSHSPCELCSNRLLSAVPSHAPPLTDLPALHFLCLWVKTTLGVISAPSSMLVRPGTALLDPSSPLSSTSLSPSSHPLLWTGDHHPLAPFSNRILLVKLWMLLQWVQRRSSQRRMQQW